MVEGAAQIVRALGFRNTAVGWAHIDWPALRTDPVAEGDRVRRIMEPLELAIDDSFIWFRNKYIDELDNELKCTITNPDKRMRDDGSYVEPRRSRASLVRLAARIADQT